MDLVWVNTWRRFFGLPARPYPRRLRRGVIPGVITIRSAPTSFGPIPELSEADASRELAKVNEREGNRIDYD